MSKVEPRTAIVLFHFLCTVSGGVQVHPTHLAHASYGHRTRRLTFLSCISITRLLFSTFSFSVFLHLYFLSLQLRQCLYIPVYQNVWHIQTPTRTVPSPFAFHSPRIALVRVDLMPALVPRLLRHLHVRRCLMCSTICR